MITEYVAGFLFDPDMSRVALIRKARGPAGMTGCLNAIGGKVEAGESPHDAMVREFWEETGLHHPDWQAVCLNVTPTYAVYFFASTDPRVDFVLSRTDEAVAVYRIEAIAAERRIADLDRILLSAIRRLGYRQ